jgi:hypothetical protein
MARAVTNVGDRIAAFASGGHLVLAVVPERDLHSLGLRLDLGDLAYVHAEDAHIVADVDAVAVFKIGNDIRAVDGVAGSEQHDHARDEQHDKTDGDPASTNAVHCPAPCPGAGTMTGLGVGCGVESSPGGGSAGGPGGGPPGGGAGSGSRYG